MTQQTLQNFTALETSTNFYLNLIRRIDAILADPVKTLIYITAKHIATEQVNFPVWMSDDAQPEAEDDLFSKAICFAIVQDVSRLKRRFSWLSGDDLKRLDFLLKTEGRSSVNRLVKNLLPKTDAFSDCIVSLSSETLGDLNPFTASQVYQVLLRDGERQTHAGIGSLALFAMIWPLFRKFPVPRFGAAAIEPWEPKAYVTAKCILPIITIQKMCSERAELMSTIVEILSALDQTHEKGKGDPYQRWLFNAELDDLRVQLRRLSRIVVANDELFGGIEDLRRFSDKLSQNSQNSASSPTIEDSYQNIRKSAKTVIEAIGKDGKAVLEKASQILEAIRTDIVVKLEQCCSSDLRDLAAGDHRLKLKFAQEYIKHSSTEKRDAYLKDLHQAALDSYKFCFDAFGILESGYRACETVGDDINSITRVASQLATANKDVAKKMEDLIRNATVWCQSVADREIAYASAQNLTDFDPSELVSAIAVAVKGNQMTTTLQVSDAVSKALTGMRADGSWSAGQPFYSPNNALGIWPVTSDVVLTLIEALEEHREVEIADAALFRYVDWLERTRTELNSFSINSQSDQKAYEGKIGKQKTDEVAVGWASDRLRHRRKIHFPTTAFSVNALLKIRDLVEYRLWQLCEGRFKVIESRTGLKNVTPVDLGAQHRQRLHRHLAWIAEQQKSDYKTAEYSLVLHGPPGSSKTVIAEALAFEQWKANRPWGSKEDPRLVRITPADFTRMGEERLDSEARLIFDLLSGLRGVTILFDEIDDLLRERNTKGDNSAATFIELVVPAMLNRLADLREACPRQQLCIVLATNFIESIEPALLRKGRIDRSFAVIYPDQESRQALIIMFTGKKLKKGLLANLNEAELGEISKEFFSFFTDEFVGWPFLDIKEACGEIMKDLEHVLGRRNSLDENEPSFKNRFLAEAMKSISKQRKKYGGTKSTDKYEKRYEERLVSSFRQELLNEYAHFIIAAHSNAKDLAEWIENKRKQDVREGSSGPEHTDKDSKIRNILTEIETILEEQHRWTGDEKDKDHDHLQRE